MPSVSSERRVESWGLRRRCDGSPDEMVPYPARDDDALAGDVMLQLVQIIGSLLVLAGFALAQLGVLDQKSRRYPLLNAIGSGVLAVNAVVEQQWGFL